MADLITHLAIPFVALLAFYDRRYLKYMIFLIPLAIIPDIDHLPMLTPLRGLLLHNVFTLIPTTVLAIYFLKKGRIRLCNLFAIATFYLVAHIILDLHYAGLLYPISSTPYKSTFNMNFYGPAVTSLGVYILLAFMLAIIISIPMRRINHFEENRKSRALSKVLLV